MSSCAGNHHQRGVCSPNRGIKTRALTPKGTNMSQILLITSSPRMESYSTRVARKLSEKLASGPGSGLTVRDLTRQPLPHTDNSFSVARNTHPEFLTTPQNTAFHLSHKFHAPP